MQYKFQPHKISITVGSIDEESVKGVLVKPSEHVFLGEKAGWFQVPEDGLQRFERSQTYYIRKDSLPALSHPYHGQIKS